MLGRAQLRLGPAERAHWIDQVSRRVGRAAFVARIAVLIGRFADWARPFDKTVSQKRAGHRVKELADILFNDESGSSQRRPKLPAQLSILRAVCAAVIVKFNLK